MAPFFVAFAILFALPHIVDLIAAEPRAALKGMFSFMPVLPEKIAPLSDMLAGWLWLPWYLAIPSFCLRQRAAWITRRAILDAVGSSMAALALQGAAWYLLGREALAADTISVAERNGAWQLMALELVFLFLTAVMFGPSTRQRIHWQHG